MAALLPREKPRFARLSTTETLRLPYCCRMYSTEPSVEPLSDNDFKINGRGFFENRARRILDYL